MVGRKDLFTLYLSLSKRWDKTFEDSGHTDDPENHRFGGLRKERKNPTPLRPNLMVVEFYSHGPLSVHSSTDHVHTGLLGTPPNLRHLLFLVRPVYP